MTRAQQKQLSRLTSGNADAAPATVQDLAYGEVLFHYFQDDYLTALTRLLAGGGVAVLAQLHQRLVCVLQLALQARGFVVQGL